MKICLIALEICQSWLKIYPYTKSTIKVFPNTCKILPNWQNFAKSGRTALASTYRPTNRQASLIGLQNKHSETKILRCGRCYKTFLEAM